MPKCQPHAPRRRWATPERGCLFDSHDAYREHSESHDPTLPEPLLLRPSSPGDAELLLSCSLLQRRCSVHGATEEPSRDLACSLLQRFADSVVAGGAIAAVRVLLVSRCASLPFGAPRTPPPELSPEARAEAEAETARKPVASETPALTPSLPLSRRAPPSGPTAAREGQGKGQRGRQGQAQRAQLARGGG